MFSQGNLPESIAEIFLAKSGENMGNEPNRSVEVIYLPYIADITIYIYTMIFASYPLVN